MSPSQRCLEVAATALWQMKTPKEIREAAGVSQLEAAVLAKVSQNTQRLYEADPNAVRGKKRAACDAVTGKMATIGRNAR